MQFERGSSISNSNYCFIFRSCSGWCFRVKFILDGQYATRTAILWESPYSHCHLPSPSYQNASQPKKEIRTLSST
jgi:hypothetical protein